MSTGTPPPPDDELPTTSKPDDDEVDDAVDEHIEEILGSGVKLDALGTAYECGYVDGLKAGCRALYIKGYQKGYLAGFKKGKAAP